MRWCQNGDGRHVAVRCGVGDAHHVEHVGSPLDARAAFFPELEWAPTALSAMMGRTAVTAMSTAGDAAMATDYDEPRRGESDAAVEEDSLGVLQQAHQQAQSPVLDVEEPDTAEGFELPGTDLSGEEFSVRVVPKQADEFTCSFCFLVHHRHRYAGERAGRPICRDCAA